MLRVQEQPPIHSFAGPEQAQAVAALLDEGGWDALFVHRLPAMAALLRAARRPPVTFFDLDDVEDRVLARRSLLPPIWPGKLAYLAHVPALLAAELRGAALARLTFVCSDLDRARMARLSRRGQFVAVPNAVAVPPEPPPLPAAPTLLFLGACDYPPNAAAAERLATRIMPLLRQAVPDARALIAGRDSDRLPSAANPGPGVEHLGFVPDLDSLYAWSRVVCCPIETGGGTRVKLVEAAAYARPMVSTRIGAEGLAFADGSEILLRDSDAEIADACARLLRDPAECARLGQAGRQRMRALYDAAQISATVGAMVRPYLEVERSGETSALQSLDQGSAR
jgi:glycosyltransferase involved in cell wall biosynthesis